MKCRVVVSGVSLVGLSLMLTSCGSSLASGGSSAATTAIAYVAHSQSHSLSVINLPAGKTVASVQIGNSSVGDLTHTPSYPTGVALTPDGSRAYVTDAVHYVRVVDTASNAVIATIAAGNDPEAIAITPDGKSAYVTTIICSVPSCPDNPLPVASVEVIDTASNSVTATVTVGNLPTVQAPGVLLSGIAISPDGTRAYVSNGQGNQIWSIDTASHQVVATIPTAASSGFTGVSISPDGRRLYAASGGNPSVVDVIDTKADAVVTSISLPGYDTARWIALTPDGSHAYATGETGHVWVIDTTKNALVTTIGVTDGQPLFDIAFTADGTRGYIACGNNNEIYVLDTTANRIVGQISSPFPRALAIAPALFQSP
jgi:YVTN family beta-propeller protein